MVGFPAMLIRIAVCAGMLLVAHACLAQSKSEAVILSREAAVEAAQLQKDFAALEDLWTPDYFITNSRGVVVRRDAWISDFKRGRASFSAPATKKDVMVRLYGDHTAVVTGESIRTKIFEGKETTDHLRFTHVWVNFSGIWRMVAAQATALPSSQ